MPEEAQRHAAHYKIPEEGEGVLDMRRWPGSNFSSTSITQDMRMKQDWIFMRILPWRSCLEDESAHSDVLGTKVVCQCIEERFATK